MNLNDINIDIENKEIKKSKENNTSISNIKKIEKESDDIVFKKENELFDLPLRILEFSCEKETDKFIKNIERLVRTSQEYKYWIKYITEALGQAECKLTNESMHECKIEIHHHPISLYTICKCVIYEYMNKNKKFCSFDIATQVIELHFKDKVGYIPLLSDLHEKYHNGFLQLPIELVNGNYKYILDNYLMGDEERDKILDLCNVKMEKLQQNWKKNEYPGLDVNNNKLILESEIEKQKQIEKVG